MKRVASSLLLALCLTCGAPASATETERWAAYYGDTATTETLQPYQVLVLDSDRHPPIASLRQQRRLLLGYLSIGEAESYRSYYPRLQKARLLLTPSKEWEGHELIDVRNPYWTALVIEELIPAILHKGFDGVMLDTADSPIDFEAKQSAGQGLSNAVVALIRTIRMHYPHMPIMLNRGFAVLPHVAQEVDMVLAESIIAGADEKNTEPRRHAEQDTASAVALLKEAQTQAPHLKIYTLDYWPQEDEEGIKAIYTAQREHGFIPYVAATVDLQGPVPEPR